MVSSPSDTPDYTKRGAYESKIKPNISMTKPVPSSTSSGPNTAIKKVERYEHIIDECNDESNNFLFDSLNSLAPNIQ